MGDQMNDAPEDDAPEDDAEKEEVNVKQDNSSMARWGAFIAVVVCACVCFVAHDCNHVPPPIPSSEVTASTIDACGKTCAAGFRPVRRVTRDDCECAVPASVEVLP